MNFQKYNKPPLSNRSSWVSAQSKFGMSTNYKIQELRHSVLTASVRENSQVQRSRTIHSQSWIDSWQQDQAIASLVFVDVMYVHTCTNIMSCVNVYASISSSSLEAEPTTVMRNDPSVDVPADWILREDAMLMRESQSVEIQFLSWPTPLY